MKKYKYLFFDLDGTVTDSCEGIYKSFLYALEFYGVRVDDASVLKPVLGPPLKDSFMHMFGFDDQKAEKAVEKYRERFAVKGIYENRVYDGVEQMLEALCRAGYTLVLATSKPEEFAVRILKHFDLDKYFRIIRGATFDGRISTKEDVIGSLLTELESADSGEIIMIGDRCYDLAGAAAFGIDAIGVLYGYGSREELDGFPHVLLAGKPSDITEYFI